MERDLRDLLSPRSIAVVGASPKPGSVAGEILRNLVRCGFRGELFPVNPKYDRVEGLLSVSSVSELPRPVDLAVLAINRTLVLDAVEACGERGIRNLVIITAGFKESGEEGAAREERLRALIERYRLRVVGPNCMGIINSTTDSRLNASFSRWFPSGGGIAFVSQSGSLGETLLECFEDAGLGVSHFVNLGNRAGLTENDFLWHFGDDDRCRAIFLYLESFADPGLFRRLVERIGRTKPVVVLKAGRTEAGAAAVASHTGSLASPDAVVDAFLEQCGALRVTTIEETLTALRALERGTLPAGRRVIILTNAGGAGIIAADASERAGIEVPPLPAPLRRELAEFLPPEAGLGNPIDMIATARSDDYERGLRVALRAGDAAIVIFRPPLVLDEPPERVADGIARAAHDTPDRPVLVCTLSRGSTESPIARHLAKERIPVYAMPETAIDALAVLCRAQEIRQRSTGAADCGLAERDRAARTIARAEADGRSALFFDEGAELLASYGIAVCPFSYPTSPEAAARFADSVGYPVAAKVDATDLFHRFECGAVLTGISTPGELAAAFEQLRGVIGELGLADGRILVQKMLSGRELIFGLQRDPSFGPVVMFGLGGTWVEALKDVAFAVAPVSSAHAERMIRSIRSFPLLGAFRGQVAIDLTPLSRALCALGRLGLDEPTIAEIDLNPVIATAEGPAAVDILVRLRSAGATGRDDGSGEGTG